MKIIVIGAGAWGTALAVSAARNPAGHRVVLWARDGAQAAALHDTRENARYLPGIPLPRDLHVRGGDVQGLLEAVPEADLLVIATPVAGLRPTLELLQQVDVPVAWLCKGFEPAQDPGPSLPFGHAARNSTPGGAQPARRRVPTAPRGGQPDCASR